MDNNKVSKTATNKDTKTDPRAVIGLIVVAVVVWGYIYINGRSNSPPPPTPQPSQAVNQPTPTPRFEGRIVSYSPENPATLGFVAEVKNVSAVDGTFNCTVRGRDSSGTYSGFDVFSSKEPLKANMTDTFKGVIVITKEGSAFVTDVTIKC